MDGVNVSISKLLPHDEKLKGLTKNMILSGEIDIGTPIVPITLHVRKYNKVQKRMVRTEVRLEGRAYSLQSIMDKSLKEQEQEGMLRKPYPTDYSFALAKSELEGKGKNIDLD